ncbi:MAG: class I SAM-dependent methyltransferase [Ruminococcus sp.]|nr:class I SAM-dependent methyltransferase [Ruminococcus sp.]
MSSFETILKDVLSRFDISVSDEASAKLSRYYELLIEWNEKMNLTAITEAEDVALPFTSRVTMPLTAPSLILTTLPAN